MKRNLLIVHGGGPTAVINASLYGAIKEAKKSDKIEHIYGARNGTGGVLRKDFALLENLTEQELELLLQTPGSAIGTSRDQLEQAEYEAMAKILEEENIGYVLFNGGNGTMDTCGKLYQTCQALGVEAYVMGIPKTMDNDLAVTDHSPGYGSAARYIAQSTRELCADVQGLPIHVVVLEASGRNAGWITAASALADQGDGLGPDLIYLPEVPFDEEQFLADVKRLLEKKSGIVVVASEGLKKANGEPVVDPIFQVGRSVYFGDVSAHLANLVIRHLGYKARGEKPGLLGRASMTAISKIDQAEAALAGEAACRAVLAGETGKMVAFRRIRKAGEDYPSGEGYSADEMYSAGETYQAEPFLVDVKEVMIHERTMPREFINEAGNGVTEAFKEWCEPLLGGALPEMITRI